MDTVRIADHTTYAEAATHRRIALAPGLDAWIYEYGKTAGARVGATATYLEVGVQLSGTWAQAGARSGRSLFERGALFTLSPGERYDLAFEAQPEPGIVVGYNIDPLRFADGQFADAEFVLDEAFRRDRRLFDCSVALRDAVRAERPLPEVGPTLSAYLFRTVDVAARSAAWTARRVLDETYESPLYVEHIADAVGMHPRTLRRRFAERFGQTMVAYRNARRLDAMARLLWAAPERSIAQIVDDVGFTSPSLAHRAFKRAFGTTPAIHGGRTLRPSPARLHCATPDDRARRR